jgi:hypothetical protein
MGSWRFRAAGGDSGATEAVDFFKVPAAEAIHEVVPV